MKPVVVVDPRTGAAARTREDLARPAFARGELSLDWYDMRPALEGLGISYIQADQEGS